MTWLISAFSKLRAFKKHSRFLWKAFKHPETPLWIKILMGLTVLYVLSPIDLIPDFILILGWTDDLVAITLAMWLLGKAIPDHIRKEIEMPN